MPRAYYEALELVLQSERDQGDEFVIYSEGPLSASVCSSLDKDEVITRMAKITCGTTTGWVFADEPFATGETNPCLCNQNPQTHHHYLFHC